MPTYIFDNSLNVQYIINAVLIHPVTSLSRMRYIPDLRHKIQKRLKAVHIWRNFNIMGWCVFSRGGGRERERHTAVLAYSWPEGGRGFLLAWITQGCTIDLALSGRVARGGGRNPPHWRPGYSPSIIYSFNILVCATQFFSLSFSNHFAIPPLCS